MERQTRYRVRGLAGKIGSLAGNFRVDALKPPPRQELSSPPPGPPLVELRRGVAANLPRIEPPLPASLNRQALPPRVQLAKPIGLAARIPPLRRGGRGR